MNKPPSTSIQEYESPADLRSGTHGPLIARVVLRAAMAVTALDAQFRPMSNFAPSSTAAYGVNPILQKRIRDLFDQGAHEFFEDGMESRFSRSLMMLLREEGAEAVRATGEYLLSGSAKADVASETLRWLGDLGDNNTLTTRWEILKHSLNDKSPTVRDGAILGFANLNDPQAITALSEAKRKEPIVELRKLIDQVVEQLQKAK